MKKKVIYAILAVVILGVGIFLGVMLSKGGDGKEKTDTVTDNTDNKKSEKAAQTDTDTRSDSGKDGGENESYGDNGSNKGDERKDDAAGTGDKDVENDKDKVTEDLENKESGNDPAKDDKGSGDGSGKEDKGTGTDDGKKDGGTGTDDKNLGKDNKDIGTDKDKVTDDPSDKGTGDDPAKDDKGSGDGSGKEDKETGTDDGKKDDETGTDDKNLGKDNKDIGTDKDKVTDDPSDKGTGDDPAKDDKGSVDGSGKEDKGTGTDDGKKDGGTGTDDKDLGKDNKDIGTDKDKVTDDPSDKGTGDDPAKEDKGSGDDSGKDDKGTGTDDGSDIKEPKEVVIAKPEAVINTGKLTEKGNGYEGTKGTGKYNYGEALQKSLLFYELQRSGKLPDKVRCNWRGDSGLNDGKDNGLDLTGGWYDAGDNVKFNLPMSYTAAMLGWSVIEDSKAYEESGQLSYALGNIKWANDYFIKCHPSDEVYYYQVGDGNQDHSYWGAAETVEYRMNRPSYKVTKSNPGSAVCGETAASLAICSIVYKNIDASYSSLCLKHAKSLYKFARDTKSDSGYTAANGFYNSWSGFYDELAWSGAWLYYATGDKTYLTNAEEDYKNANHDYDWAMCWDDVHIGAAVMLAGITDKQTYKNDVEKHLDWWSGVSSDHITYSPKGLAWLDSWGSLRYATTTSFIALSYVESGACSKEKVKAYTEFAEKQADYALGSSGRSFMVGFGENAPKNPHHRTAQGSYCDNMNEPNPARHTLYGALVGGPDANDGYTDTVSDYNKNEVACDYNAGFTGLLAKMYKKYHGQTLKDFGAVEKIDTNEFYVQGGINVDGTDFIEIKALICNVSAWPARGGEKLEYRYYVDLSEVYKAGGNAKDVAVTTNYMAAGKSAGLKVWDEENHIYYLSVDFSDSVIYPGGQDKYKKEIQVRLRNQKGVWDNSNDPSFKGMDKGGNALLTSSALYENGKLIFGSEPAKGKNAGKTVITGDDSKGGEKDGNGKDEDGNGKGQDGGNDNGSGKGNDVPGIDTKGEAKNKAVSVSIEYDSTSSSSSSISGRLIVKNISDGNLSVKDLKIKFYFTNEDGKTLTFDCYHTCINGASGSYNQLSGCSGEFGKAKGKNADTVCTISYSDSASLGIGDSLACNFAIHHTDWSNMNLTNDHSVTDAKNIVIISGKKQIFGSEPD